MLYRIFRCPKCTDISTAKEWNDTTIADFSKNKIVNRAARRAYKPIQLSPPNSDRWYTCPLCGTHVQRNTIKPLVSSAIIQPELQP